MANRVRDLRRELDMTQAELAKAVNMSASAIAMMERGDCGITSNNAVILCKFFNCSIEYLLGESNIRKNPDIQLLASLKGDKLEIMKKLNELNDDQLHDLKTILDLLYK